MTGSGSSQPVVDSLASILGARVYDLSQPFDTSMASRPGHVPFRMGSIYRHGDGEAADGGSATLELITMSTHTGTHVDAIAHIARQGSLFGDLEVASAMAGGQFTTLDVEAISPILFRGVLLDVAGAFEVDAVEAGFRVGAAELQRAADQAGIAVHQGDAVLVRLGWGSGERYGSDPYLGVEGQLPGIDVSGARWLVEHGIALAGTDTIAFECLAPGDPLRPVHQILLRDNGVYIVENLALEALAAASITAFALVVAPLRFVGATGGAVRPIALVP